MQKEADKKTLDSLLKNCNNEECADGSVKIPLNVYREIVRSFDVFSRTNVGVNEEGLTVHEFELDGTTYKTTSDGPIEYPI